MLWPEALAPQALPRPPRQPCVFCACVPLPRMRCMTKVARGTRVCDDTCERRARLLIRTVKQRANMRECFQCCCCGEDRRVTREIATVLSPRTAGCVEANAGQAGRDCRGSFTRAADRTGGARGSGHLSAPIQPP